jgi:hypothetical protein
LVNIGDAIYAVRDEQTSVIPEPADERPVFPDQAARP